MVTPWSKACNAILSLLTRPEVDIGVVAPEAIILSTNGFRIEIGDLIYLVYILVNAFLPPQYVFWNQNERRKEFFNFFIFQWPSPPLRKLHLILDKGFHYLFFLFQTT